VKVSQEDQIIRSNADAKGIFKKLPKNIDVNFMAANLLEPEP
tara:strand:+ start:70 stop:195 length:126 start_codon:yes stop_codon:yes gene_type:complete